MLDIFNVQLSKLPLLKSTPASVPFDHMVNMRGNELLYLYMYVPCVSLRHSRQGLSPFTLSSNKHVRFAYIDKIIKFKLR